MSRIEDALKKARLLRSLLEESEWSQEPQGSLTSDNGINVLIISRDPRVADLINSLQSLLQAEIITSDDIAQGMNSFLEKRFIEIDKYELKFTARMLNNLCCYCGIVGSD